MSTDEEKYVVYIDEDLEDLIPGFLDNRANDITEMSAALSRKDFESIKDFGHKMQGAGGGYGFDAIS